MKKILTVATVILSLPGCSIMSSSSPEIDGEKFTTSIFEDAPICNFKMLGRQTYWSSFEDGKVYLFVGNARTKCLLK